MITSIYMPIACITCNRQIRDGIYNGAFYPNLLTMLSAFIAIAVIVALLWYLNSRRHRSASKTNDQRLSPIPLATAAMVLGIGLGGFADGIILHQILQWHEMLSAKVPANTYVGKSINMFWDGIFHAFCLMVVLIGVYMLWRASRLPNASQSGKLLAGNLLTGWGIFNIVEGVIDHQILKLHNVMEYSPNHDLANYTFLGGSVLMIVLGWWIATETKIPTNRSSNQF